MTEGNRDKKGSMTREILEWVVTIAVAVLLAMAVHTWIGQLVVVDGPSMQPNLYTGEIVAAGKIEYRMSKPKRGDIVIVRFPDSDKNYIKRVIGLGGERLSISDGSVFIDGKKLDEPYVAYPKREVVDEFTVPADSIFVMGDNRIDSTDSRAGSVGPIPLNEVVGRAYSIIWPLNRLEKLTNYTGIIEK